jgi:PAS domain S-box-containing protein
MGWLAFGVLYSIGYAIVGWLLRDSPEVLSWFRAVALLVPPMTGAVVVFSRRHSWSGCQWLFWATIALGLTMSAIGLTGWAADELIFRRQTWLAWPAVFALFGGMAPLFALLAQPHRGAREPLAVTTAVDIAGLAVVIGFLYSFFVITPDASQAGVGSSSLRLVSELQQGLVLLGMVAATFVGRRTPWGSTYRRLALGALVAFVTLTLSNVETAVAGYRAAFVYDLTWILPFAFFAWAATMAPASDADDALSQDKEELTRPRPWVIFVAVALLPFADYGLRRLAPNAAFDGYRDLSTALTIMSVLPLLVARIAAERGEMQQASGTTRLLAQVIEQAHDLILVLTPDGRCRHANDAFCRAIGFSHDELATMHSRSLMVRESISAEDIQSVVRSGRAWQGTLTRTRRDGTTFPVQASVAGLLDERGRVSHVVSVERDISEERRLRQQLIHSERLSAVGQLVAGVAHEINNPLQGIIGYTELLLGGHGQGDIRHDLEQIHSDANRVAKIVHHLLAFARRSSLDRAVADLNEVVRSTLVLRKFDFRTGNITLDEQLSGQIPLIVINREEIQQIILNLVLNAEQAIRDSERHGVIHVRTGVADGSVFVEVSDDGPGIPLEMAGRIFEPFFTTKPVGQGTGLGLSVSLGIAEAHGGSLALEPRERGSCFRLTLPEAVQLQVDLSELPQPA